MWRAHLDVPKPDLILDSSPGSRTAISVKEQVALTAPAPVPTASTKQEHNQNDNQNSFF
jgi:hypothetical protein